MFFNEKWFLFWTFLLCGFFFQMLSLSPLTQCKTLKRQNKTHPKCLSLFHFNTNTPLPANEATSSMANWANQAASSYSQRQLQQREWFAVVSGSMVKGTLCFGNWLFTHSTVKLVLGLVAARMNPKYVFNSSRSDVEVRLGEHDLWEPDGTEQHIMSAKFIRHPDYDSRTQDSDIMLIKLSQPATLNSFMRFATLPSKCASDGSMCQISGWGSLRPSDEGCELHAVRCLITRETIWQWENALFIAIIAVVDSGCLRGRGRKDKKGTNFVWAISV